MTLGTELLGMTLPTVMFALLGKAVSLDFTLTAKWLLCCQNPHCAWCQKKVNSHYTLPQNQSGDCTYSVCWKWASRHIVSSTAGHVSSRGGCCFHLFPSSLISFPQATFTEVLNALDLAGLNQCWGYLITLKRRGKSIYFLLRKQWH